MTVPIPKAQDLILTETADFIAINKPSGVLTIPDRIGKEASLKTWLQERYDSIFTVHRIDRDTSGLVIFARNEKAHQWFSQQFENRQTTKIYHGLVLGKPAQQQGVINVPIGEHPTKKGMMTVVKKGKDSITEYQVLDSFRFYSWMEFNILTGRTHQIRVHMKSIGNPLVCDELYGDGKPVLISNLKARFNQSKKDDEERPILNRLALHASRLSILAPDGTPLTLEAPLPKDLKATLNQLSKTKPSTGARTSPDA